MRKRYKVAFICVHNSCRSQIAEALGKYYASDVFESYSAGTETKPMINQDAVRIMKELYGIDMEKSQRSKLLSDIPPVDVVITMGCNVHCLGHLTDTYIKEQHRQSCGTRHKNPPEAELSASGMCGIFLYRFPLCYLTSTLFLNAH